MKKIYFLGGLPRSGSTLLGSLLNQHPEIYTTPTSPLTDFLFLINQNFNYLDLQYTYEKEKIEYNIYTSVINNFYNHISKKYIIDKHRAWTKNLSSIKKFYTDEPKVIATYRTIPEIISSYISLIEKENQYHNFIDEKLREDDLKITNTNRAEYIWRFFLSDPYESLVYGITNFKKNIHLINYDDLMLNPQTELNKIYEFLEIEYYTNDFNNIQNTCKEKKDKMWGLNGLHDIRSSISKISKNPIDVIGEKNVKLYSKFNL